MKSSRKISKNSISLAGEFAVLSQLALRGYDANMTLGHTKNVDILVMSPRTGKMYKLEVKTNYQNSRNKPSRSKLFGYYISAWIMNKKHEKIKDQNLFYCFVNVNKKTNLFRFFIVPNKVVANYIREQHRLWLRIDKKHKDSPMRQFRIGTREEKYRIPTPTKENYENNWDFRK